MTVLAFLDALRARHPTLSGPLCSTAANNGYNLDTQAPAAVTDLVSASHAVNVESPVARIEMTWTPPTDDWSGATGYSVLLSAGAPAAPDQVAEIGAVASWISPATNPGTYWFTIRAVDVVGHWSTSYATAGPYLIRAPSPVDFAPVTPAGWTRPLVLRNQSTGVTTSSGLFTSRLVGDKDSTWWSIAGTNHGEATLWALFNAGVYVDGIRKAVALFDGVLAGGTIRSMNRGPLQVPGGRHSLAMRWDATGTRSASRTKPTTCTAGSTCSSRRRCCRVRSSRAPPAKYAGADMLTEGLQLLNEDGLRMGSASAWNAVAIRPMSDADDYECRLHFATTSIDTGFGSARATSARGAGLLDAVVVNRRTLPGSTWDVGVLNTSGGTGNYTAEYVSSTALGWNVPEVVTLLPGRTIALRELYVSAGQVGKVAVRPTIIAGHGTLHLQWRSSTFTLGGLMGNATDLTFPSECCPALVVDANSAGYYGVLLYRDPRDGLDTVVVEINAGPVPPDLRPYATSSWYAPLVPRPAADALLKLVPAPDTLVGDANSTWLNYSMQASPYIDTGPVSAEVRVDGTAVFWPYWSSTTAGSYNVQISRGPVQVRGGRHTLTVRYDPLDLIGELLETNNASGEQWVWSPASLALEAPVVRAAPPAAFDGWDDLGADSTLHFNCDGVRTPLFAASGQDGVVGSGGRHARRGERAGPAMARDLAGRQERLRQHARDVAFGPRSGSSWCWRTSAARRSAVSTRGSCARAPGSRRTWWRPCNRRGVAITPTATWVRSRWLRVTSCACTSSGWRRGRT